MKFIEVAVSQVKSVLINLANVSIVEQAAAGSLIHFVGGKKLAVIHNTHDLNALILAAQS